MYINLSGLVVLITGGSTGLGKAIAMRIAESGATVALQYPKATAESEEVLNALGQARGYSADLGSIKAPAALISEVLRDMGSLDVLINSASAYKPVSLQDQDAAWYEAWRYSFAVHLEATTLLCKQAIQYWKKNKLPGRIINISTPDLPMTEQIDHLAYWVSKKSIELFTKGLSQATHADKIRLFTIVPPRTRDEKHIHFSNKTKEGASQVHKGTPRDAAPLAAFLCSGLADYASGSTIDMSVAV